VDNPTMAFSKVARTSPTLPPSAMKASVKPLFTRVALA
jgi:hypothetical protein